MDDLRETVISLLVEHGCGTSGQLAPTADAAIAVVLERAAKVAENEANALDDFCCRQHGADIATAIRALAEESKG